MTKRLLRGLLTGALAVAAGCGSDGKADDCKTEDGFICGKDLHGFPFATDALVASDYCAALDAPCVNLNPPTGATTATMTHPEPGKLCLSGWLSAGGWAVLSMDFARANADLTAIAEPFDAAARGITQVAFTLDAVPEQPLWLNGHSVQHESCPSSPLDCVYPPNYVYGQLTTPGRITAPLADFKSELDPNQSLDTTRMVELFLQIGAPSGDYGFCISDLTFLDAAGGAVTP